mmetsp:Transcript_16684/g.37520  ORF Transcript_16684/g.37520 Transcript_16684/m.37520 type:complete len:174 (-) Transcript_16684:110-631(-)
MRREDVVHGGGCGCGVLLPALSSLLRRVTLWEDFHLRWSPKACFPPVPEPLLPYLADAHRTPVLAVAAAADSTLVGELDQFYGMMDENEALTRSVAAVASAQSASPEKYNGEVPQAASPDNNSSESSYDIVEGEKLADGDEGEDLRQKLGAAMAEIDLLKAKIEQMEKLGKEQ